MSVDHAEWTDNRDEAQENQALDPRAITLAYLTTPAHSANSFVGALLLTDGRTRPLHFAFTDPVAPSTMQRILHGSTLEPQIKIDVIAAKLFESLPRQPDVVFVNSKDLLSARELLRKPTACLSKATSEGDGQSLSTVTYDTGGNVSDQNTVGQIICQLNDVDLLEPFARLTEALREAQKQVSTKAR